MVLMRVLSTPHGELETANVQVFAPKVGDFQLHTVN